MPRKRETSPIVLNYLRLIREQRHPYNLVVKRFVDDAAAYYEPRSPEEIIYTINPKWLHRELDQEVKHEKLTVKNISRLIRAFLHGRNVEYYTTTTSGGCQSYHIELNPEVVIRLKKPDEPEQKQS